MWKKNTLMLLPFLALLTACPVDSEEASPETPQQNQGQQGNAGNGPPGDPNLATPPTEGGELGGAPASYNGQLFKDLIVDDQSIDLTLNVTGANSFEMEFQICKETGGRKQPTVIHKQVDGLVTIKVPRTRRMMFIDPRHYKMMNQSRQSRGWCDGPHQLGEENQFEFYTFEESEEKPLL